jgi:hypothetical protein
MTDGKDTNSPPVSQPQGGDSELLANLQRETFDFFSHEYDPSNGLIPDSTKPGSPASITAIGFGLSAFVVAAQNGFLSRAEVIKRVLTTLLFLSKSPQGPESDAAGYKGFYYHFLDMKSGRRAGDCELSSIDTALLMAGVLCVGQYFDGTESDERAIRELSEEIYSRVEWDWMTTDKGFIRHGWKPESGFLQSSWDQDYCEAIILYVLAMGAPKHGISNKGYVAWTSTFKTKEIYGYKYLYAGPLFIHQFSHLWIDFMGIRDEFNRQNDFDYFENSRRASLVQREYAIENPQGFASYSENGWGLTASDGPGPKHLKINGIEREFFGYTARGAPFGPDDGTLAPWAVVASLPFAPNEVLAAMRHAIERLELKNPNSYGFDASFNPTFPERDKNRHGWVAPWRLGLNQGPIILMIENYNTRLIWNLMRGCPAIVRGLRIAGFGGGWLSLT